MFFATFEALCKQKGVSKQKACLDCGLSRTAWNKWKAGAVPNGEALQTFADYFGVTTDYLLTGEEIKKAPTLTDERQVSDEDIKFALFGGDGEITDAMYDEVKRFAKMVKLRDEAEREKK